MKLNGYGGTSSRPGTLSALLRPTGLTLLVATFLLGFWTKTITLEMEEKAAADRHSAVKRLSSRRKGPHGTVAGEELSGTTANIRGHQHQHEAEAEEAPQEQPGGSSSSTDASLSRFITNVAQEPPLPTNPLTKAALTPLEYRFSAPESETVKAWPHKNDWGTANDANGEWWSILYAWEPETQIAYRSFIQRASNAKHGKAVVIDFGAWIGPTVLLSAMNNAGGRVIGIEPDLQAFSEAYHNIKLNAGGSNPNVKASTVELYHLCISDAPGELEMHGTPGDSMSTLNPTESDKKKPGFTSWKVECQTLPDFLTSGAPKSNVVPVAEGGSFVPVDPADIALIKIDTEGHEKKLLPALKPWLLKHKPSILLSMHAFMYQEDTAAHAAILDVVKSYKYALLPDGRNANTESGFSIVGWCRLCTLLLTDESVPEGYSSWQQLFTLPEKQLQV